LTIRVVDISLAEFHALEPGQNAVVWWLVDMNSFFFAARFTGYVRVFCGITGFAGIERACRAAGTAPKESVCMTPATGCHDSGFYTRKAVPYVSGRSGSSWTRSRKKNSIEKQIVKYLNDQYYRFP
jgi:hypothetical protein